VFDDQPTPLDLRLRLFGFPVRVSPWFWLVMALLGDFTFRDPVLGPAGLVVWVACGFVSILVHELGHALAGRWFGTGSQVVLLAFGGVTVYNVPPRSGWRRMATALAGPAAGFLLLGAVVGSESAVGWAAAHPVLVRVYLYLVWMNVFWNLLNLLPIWPLDGGRVCREVFYILGLRRPDPAAFAVSLVASGALAAVGVLVFLNQAPPWLLDHMPYIPGPFMTLWFILFAVQSYLLLQQANRQAAWGSRYYEDVDDDTPPWRKR